MADLHHKQIFPTIWMVVKTEKDEQNHVVSRYWEIARDGPIHLSSTRHHSQA